MYLLTRVDQSKTTRTEGRDVPVTRNTPVAIDRPVFSFFFPYKRTLVLRNLAQRTEGDE